MRTLFIISFLAYAIVARAQDSLIVSAPIDISSKGWTKLLQVQGGNTLLFHFEVPRRILVKVFDKEGKEISSKQHDDIDAKLSGLSHARYIGLYEINGEAVLFIQDKDVLRLRFSVATGGLIEQVRVVNTDKQPHMQTFVFKGVQQDGYRLLTYVHNSNQDSVSVTIYTYDDKHILKQQQALKLDYHNLYTYMACISAIGGSDGSVMFILEGREVVGGDANVTMILGYMPGYSNQLITKNVKLPLNTRLINSYYKNNSFSNNLNLILETDNALYGENSIAGMDKQNDYTKTLHILPQDLSTIKSVNFNFVKANEYIREKYPNEGKLRKYKIFGFNTDDVGLSTIITQEHSSTIDISRMMSIGTETNVSTGRIVITKYGDNGNEIAGVVLPEIIPNFTPQELSKGEHALVLGKSTDLSMYRWQPLFGKKSCYILYNTDSSLGLSISRSVNDVSFKKLYAAYYALNNKDVLTRRYLLPVSDTVISQLYPDSESFDYRQNKLAVLIRQIKDNTETFHIAWKKLEN